MGKKRITIIGSEDEAELKAKRAVKLEQKKHRLGKSPASSDSETVSELAAPPVDPSPTPEPETPASPSTPKRTHHRSSAYKSAKQQVDSDRTYPLTEALALLRRTSLTHFDPTVELHLVLKDKGFSKEVELPHSTGKVRRIAIADEATLQHISAGQIDFDVLLATPEQMPQLVKFAKVLGPKGLMPNPKNGTVVPHPESTAKSLSQKNSLLLRTEKDAPLIHLTIGKLSLSDSHLTDNIQAILSVIPNLKKAVLKSTMSPAIKITT